MQDGRSKRLPQRFEPESFIPNRASIADSALIEAFVRLPRSGFTLLPVRAATSAPAPQRGRGRSSLPAETNGGRIGVPHFCLDRRLLVLLRLLCFLLGCHLTILPFHCSWIATMLCCN